MGDGQMSVLLFRLKVKAEVDLRSSTQTAFIRLFVQVFRRKGIRRMYFTRVILPAAVLMGTICLPSKLLNLPSIFTS